MSLLTVTDVSKRFPGQDTPALSNVNLSARPGELLALVGESGSGKTTLLRIIAGLEDPTSGRIELHDRCVVDDQSYIAPEKRGVGMVFQDYALFPHLNALENVGFGLKNLKKKARAAASQSMLELVGLQDFGSRYPHEMSGGQQQRVALARALAPEPSILLLDEPFSNLDASLKSTLREELQRILNQLSITTLLVTHDTKEALRIADRIAVLRNGRLQQTAAPQEIYCEPRNAYIARFFGKTNILPLPAALLHQAHCRDQSTSDKCLERSDICVRPEHFEIVPPGSETSNCLEGVVERITFCGDYQEVRFSWRLPNRTSRPVTLFTNPEYPIAISDTIYVRPKRFCLLERSSDGPVSHSETEPRTVPRSP